MHAGVIRSTFKKSDLNQAVKEFKETALPALAAHQGNRSGMLLVDRDSGETVSIAIYEDEASAKAFGPKAFSAHDLEAVARDSAPDIELTAPGGIKVQGVQAAKEYNQTWLKAFPDARIENKKIIAQGNTVVVEGAFSGTHAGPLKTPMGEVPPTGRKLKGEFIQVFEIDRGLVKRNYLMYDQVEVMTQLGMAPAGAKSTA